jgi:hypothetical protein
MEPIPGQAVTEPSPSEADGGVNQSIRGRLLAALAKASDEPFSRCHFAVRTDLTPL